MRLAIASLAGFVACAPPAAPPAPARPRPIEIVAPLPTVQRPALSLAFLIDGLPPPLTHPPALEPSYHVWPPWPSVCQRRGPLADDVLEYIIAWCDSRTGKRDTLVRALLAAWRSHIYHLDEAAAEDLANLLADDDTEEHPAMPERVTDYLAALYVVRDRVLDALAVLDTAPSTYSREAMCERSVSRVLARPDLGAGAQLTAYGDTRCGHRAALLRCAIERAALPDPFLAERDRHGSPCPESSATGDDLAGVRLAQTYLRWRPDEPGTWRDAIESAIDAMPAVVDAEDFAVSALEAQSRICDAEARAGAKALAKRLAGAPGHAARFDERIAPLLDALPECLTR